MVISIWRHNLKFKLKFQNFSNVFNFYFGHCKYEKIVNYFAIVLTSLSHYQFNITYVREPIVMQAYHLAV